MKLYQVWNKTDKSNLGCIQAVSLSTAWQAARLAYASRVGAVLFVAEL